MQGTIVKRNGQLINPPQAGVSVASLKDKVAKAANKSAAPKPVTPAVPKRTDAEELDAAIKAAATIASSVKRERKGSFSYPVFNVPNVHAITISLDRLHSTPRESAVRIDVWDRTREQGDHTQTGRATVIIRPGSKPVSESVDSAKQARAFATSVYCAVTGENPTDNKRRMPFQ